MKDNELYLEYVKASKEETSALDIWSQYDKENPFSRTTLEAFKAYTRASDRRDKAFDAWLKAIKEN